MLKKALIAFLIGAGIMAVFGVFYVTIGGDSTKNLHLPPPNTAYNDTTWIYSQTFSMFKPKQLPISLHDILIHKAIGEEAKMLDSMWVIENIRDSINLLGPYQYQFFPVCKFLFHDSLTGIIIIKRGSAGGMEDHHMLYMFNKKNILIGWMEIGGEFSEGTADTESFAKIESNGNIYIQNKAWEEHDDPEWKGERLTEKTGKWQLAFMILPNGKIDKK